MEDLIEALKKTTIFGALAHCELEALAQISVEKKTLQEEVLYRMGDRAEGVYLILAGAIRAERSSPDGRKQTIHVEREGATIADVPTLDGGPVPSNLIALKGSHLLFLPRREFLQLCQERPAICFSLLLVLSKRLRHCVDLISVLSFRPTGQRLAQWLLQHSLPVHDSTFNSQQAQVELRLTNQEIADQIGTVREVISRSLALLKKNGLVSGNGRILQIPDVIALEDYANFGTNALKPKENR
jgi:CRP-like cAMP-binding protein